ncbi:YdeI family protein [Conexibacter sp. SYSU D00693]|uniref:YdeI/OmpD-associated family protein n=1 Tax=Conexibacter sp. SYSU D00693 TaxID=2812560 RepID=UPI00196BB18B|nr:YdeI/OmpD-associated family protein [Conexibacter sp. SYSU D00693]
MAKPGEDGLPVLSFEDAAAFEAWLEANHDGPGLWMKLAKKGAGVPSVTRAEALDLALCFGWIDGQSHGIDETWTGQRWVPRRPRSRWSRINTEKAEALIAEGRMRPSGMAEVEKAKADGRWDAAYEPPSTATVPADLQAALDADPQAAAAFAALDATNRYAVLHRVTAEAKRPGTRERRIERLVAMLAAGQKLHP